MRIRRRSVNRSDFFNQKYSGLDDCCQSAVDGMMFFLERGQPSGIRKLLANQKRPAQRRTVFFEIFRPFVCAPGAVWVPLELLRDVPSRNYPKTKWRQGGLNP